MSDEELLADLNTAIGTIQQSLENTLKVVRRAEGDARDARTVLQRIQRAVLRRADGLPPPVAPSEADPKSEKLNVRPKEAALLLGCGMKTVYGLMQRGELQNFKRGKARLITTSSLRRVAAGLAPLAAE